MFRKGSVQQANQFQKAQQSSEFLLIEFEMLHQRASVQEQVIANKINFHLAATTAIIGALILASDSSRLGENLLVISVLSLGFLFLMGIASFYQTLDVYIMVTKFYRRAGRIRAWFYDQNEAIEPFLGFKVTDQRPKYFSKHTWLRGVETILVTVNALVFTVFVFMLLLLVNESELLGFQNATLLSEPYLFATILIGLFIFGLSWLMQTRIARRRFTWREQMDFATDQIHFPAS